MDNQEVNQLLTITKSQLRKYCIHKMFEVRPEFANSISNKLLNNALVFIEGYASAIANDIMPPFNKKEIHELLLLQGFLYIKKHLA